MVGVSFEFRLVDPKIEHFDDPDVQYRFVTLPVCFIYLLTEWLID